MRILPICEAHIWEYLLILEKSRVVSTSMKIWILYSLVLCFFCECQKTQALWHALCDALSPHIILPTLRPIIAILGE